MRVHWLQHAPEDDLGCIAPWLAAHGHAVSRTAWFAGDLPPPVQDFDALIVMGGAMNVDEVDQYPWLATEKRFLAEVLAARHRLLGICLGAQLIAEQLGARVGRHREREIGWFDIRRTPQARGYGADDDWPERLPVLHWHGDRFDLPPGAQHLAFSEACDQQAFSLDDGRVLGLQFHPEITAAGLRSWLASGVPGSGAYVQDAATMLQDLPRFGSANRFLYRLLERWLS